MNGYSPFSYQIFPPEYFEKKAIRKTALFTGLLFVMYLASSFFIGTVVGFFTVFFNVDVTTASSAETVQQIIFMITYLLTMIIPFGVFTLINKIPLKAAFPMRAPRPSLALPAIVLTLGASVIGIMLASALINLFALFDLNYDVSSAAMDVPSTPFAKVLYLISLSVLPAIFEELAFRGVLMQSLRRHGDTFALVVSAAVFSLFHGNFMQIPNTFILGLVIGFFVLRTDSLITGMLMHFFNNFIVTLVDMFLISEVSESEGTLITLALLGFYVIIGLAALLYFILKEKQIFSLMPSYTYLTTPQKLKAFFSHPMMIAGVVLMLLLCLMYFAPL